LRSDANTPAFLEVELTPEASVGAFEIQCGEGVTIRVLETTSEEGLRRLLKALRSAC
jgi:hypothetical protein